MACLILQAMSIYSLPVYPNFKWFTSLFHFIIIFSLDLTTLLLTIPLKFNYLHVSLPKTKFKPSLCFLLSARPSLSQNSERHHNPWPPNGCQDRSRALNSAVLFHQVFSYFSSSPPTLSFHTFKSKQRAKLILTRSYLPPSLELFRLGCLALLICPCNKYLLSVYLPHARCWRDTSDFVPGNFLALVKAWFSKWRHSSTVYG